MKQKRSSTPAWSGISWMNDLYGYWVAWFEVEHDKITYPMYTPSSFY